MARPDLSTWAAAFAAASSTDEAVAEFVDVVDSGILAQMPQLGRDPMLVQDLHASTRGHWLAFTALLSRPEHQLDLPVQAEDLARSVARRGHDVAVLLKMYRAAHRGIFEYMTAAVDRLGEDDPPRDEVLKLLWSRADQWIDESVEVLMDVFYAEKQHRHDDLVVRRAGVIAALAEGVVMTPDEASAALEHPMRHWHSAFVLWSEAGGVDSAENLHRAADAIGRDLAGVSTLVHLAGSRDLWCWVATIAPPKLASLDTVAEGVAHKYDVRIARGLSGPGLGGFRSTHAQALAVHRMCLASSHRRAVVGYGEVELLCLAMENDPGLLAAMVAREVAPLVGGDRNLEAVRETALTYLTHRMNVEATAEKLFVHKNTVRYRLARAEELLGRPLAERSAQLELALLYLHWFGTPRSLEAV